MGGKEPRGALPLPSQVPRGFVFFDRSFPMKKFVLSRRQTIGLSIGGLALAAALGGAAYAQQIDSTITRAEAANRAAEVFTRLDVNHDGRLDAADRAMMQTAMFDRLDTNHDGQISRAEFAAGGPGAPPPEGRMHHGMDDGTLGDHGMDGHHMRGHRMGSHEGIPKGMMMLQLADANKDGAVTQPEFVAAWLQHFDRADANHDGKLSRDERQAAHEAMVQRMKAMRGGMGNPAPSAPPPPTN